MIIRVEPRDLELPDIKLLRYVGKKGVKKRRLLKKFGEHRVQVLSKDTPNNPSLIY